MRRLLTLFALLSSAAPGAWAWGAAVHRLVTLLAVEALPSDAPEWLRAGDTPNRLAFLSNQADRWRGWDSAVLQHENSPEHYLDIELLDQFGLTLASVPRLRMEYVRQMAVAKYRAPASVEPYDPNTDPARVHEWPGFLLHAIAEHYAKLQAAFWQVRILERLGDPARRVELEEARAIACYHLGCLSHFVADAAQPLHTTKHYDGWRGDNPAGYRWRDKFHAYVDEGWAVSHGIDAATLRPLVRPTTVRGDDPWDDVLAYIGRSHAQVAMLYTLERDGLLDRAAGRELLVARLSDAASMLSGLIRAAYVGSEPTAEQVERWARYDRGEARPAAPATRPAQPSVHRADTPPGQALVAVRRPRGLLYFGPIQKPRSR
jgi:hypothetical protein